MPSGLETRVHDCLNPAVTAHLQLSMGRPLVRSHQQSGVVAVGNKWVLLLICCIFCRSLCGQVSRQLDHPRVLMARNFLKV